MDFFAFHEKVTRRANGSASAEPAPADKREVLSITQLTARIEKALKECLPGTLYVQGEVSNYKRHAGSGHLYFTLKDAGSCIDCVMFKSDVARLRFEPGDGMELVATGRVAVYGQRGRYQLYVTRLEPMGQGALELAFRQLCARLEAEGLFEPERKKPIPAYPQRVALVTSTQTAAVQDMLKVLRRFPWVRVYVYHVPVQGDGSAERIVEALASLNERAADLGGVDVILLGRGGGSLEDLWEFNEEMVARAMVASRIPIITGIGHEIDVSIADLVADYHAHTPTEAAQVAMAQWRGAREVVEAGALRLRREINLRLADARQRLAQIQRHEVFRRPLDRVNAARQRLDDWQRALSLAMLTRMQACRQRLSLMLAALSERHPRHRLELNRQRMEGLHLRLQHAMQQAQQRQRREVEALAARLNAVGPEQVLRRGYSITMLKKKGTVVRSAKDVRPGDVLVTRLADGSVESTAEDANQPRLFE